jgi:hypothetical protein
MQLNAAEIALYLCPSISMLLFVLVPVQVQTCDTWACQNIF